MDLRDKVLNGVTELAHLDVQSHDAERAKWDAYYGSLTAADEDETTAAFGTEFVKQVFQLLPSGGSTLEAGCGAGWQSLALARSGQFAVNLLDFSTAALEFARRTFAQNDVPASFLEGDVFDIGHPDYDLVFNAGVLEHYTFEEQVAFLRGMGSRSKKFVLALVPNALCYWYWIWRVSAAGKGHWPFGKEVPLLDMSSAFESAGLSYIGHTFLGSGWTENFIQNLPEVDEGMRQEIIQIHRSSLVPIEQRSYLIAFLGTVPSYESSELDRGIWTRASAREPLSVAESHAFLADAISLRISADNELRLAQEKAASEQAVASRHIADLQERLAGDITKAMAERDRVAAERDRVAAERDRAKNERTAAEMQLGGLTSMLNTYYRSKAWRVSREYWRIRKDGLARTPYHAARLLYHMAVPHKVRVRRWVARNPAQITPSTPSVSSVKPFSRSIAEYRDELTHILSRHKLAKGPIVFLPCVEWDIHLFQRPHQIALFFAQQGYLVMFWVHPGGPDNVDGFREIRDGLYLCSVPPEVMGSIDCPVAFTYSYNSEWAEYLSNPFLVYELIDRLEIFSEFPLDRLQDAHDRLLTRADLVVGTATDLVEDLRTRRPDAILCPNGVDTDHFDVERMADRRIPADMQAIVESNKPIVGYYGALAKWFDYDLVKYAAEALPDYEFVIIGPDYDSSLRESGILEVKNVHWLGRKDYSELPYYLRCFDVATIPFVVNEATHAVSPLKLFEYMAGQRPIVTTDLAECRKYDVTLIGRSQEDFVNKIQQAVGRRDDPVLLDALADEARRNSWHERVNVLSAALSSRHMAKRMSASPNSAAIRYDNSLEQPLTQFATEVIKRYRGNSSTDPMVDTWIAYALQTNDRGLAAVETIRHYTKIAGKRHLDIGCAYAGTPIAFAKAGAKSTGIEIDSALLTLGQANLADYPGLDCSLLVGDILESGRAESLGKFDIITCENVIEHVEEARQLVTAVRGLLSDSGLCHMAIPNAYSYAEVRHDGHYGLFGITLLDRPQAIEYFRYSGHADEYGVGEYCYTFEQYEAMFNAAGLTLEQLNRAEPTEAMLAALHADIETLREQYAEKARSGSIPKQLRDEVMTKLTEYLSGYDIIHRAYLVAHGSSKQSLGRQLFRHYRQDLWMVLVRPQ